MKYTATVTTEFTPEDLSGFFSSCFEGGYSPWIHSCDYVSGDTQGAEVIFWGHDAFYASPFAFSLVYDKEEDEEGAGKGTIVITDKDIQRGLKVMSKKCPHQFAQLVAREYDALSADCFVQCIVFGDAIYG
jgi:hypothetical protein